MAKHDKTLSAVFARPTRANIAWKDVEALLGTSGQRSGRQRDRGFASPSMG